MTIEVAVVQFLLATSPVATPTASRIYQLVLPQSCGYPAVRVQLLMEPVIYGLDGPRGLRMAHIQTDAVTGEASGDDPYADVASLAAAIDVALSGYTGPMGSPSLDVRGVFRQNRIPLYESEELRVVRIMQDYQVWYRAA